MKTSDFTKKPVDEFWETQFEDRCSDDELRIQGLDQELSESMEKESSGDTLVRFLKRAFIFLPGAWFLFFMSSAVFYAFFTKMAGLVDTLFVIPFLILCSFMVMFGIGDVKNPKHLLLPLSIIALSFPFFLVAFLIDGTSMMWFLSYYIYLLPVALVAPFIVKEMVGETD